MPYTLHTATELQQVLARQFSSWYVQGPSIFNSRYLAVTAEWVNGQFAKYYFDYLVARDDLVYSSRGNQCEHFGIRAALEAVELFAKTQDPQIPAEAESIGVAWAKYSRADGRGWHECNLWFIGGTWLPWEPQTQTFFTFTAAEAATVQQIGIP